MPETGKGALAGVVVGVVVGGVVGVVQAVLWAVSAPWDGHSGTRGPYTLPMTVAAFVIGAVAARQVRLRLWPLVAFAGGIATLALGEALWRVTPETTNYGFQRWLLGGVHLLAAVAGFAVAAWLVAATRRWWSRIAMLGVLAAVCVLAVPLAEPASRWHLARGFTLVGVPLVAPHLPGYRLYEAAAPVVGGAGEPVIMLEYRRVGAETVGGSRLGIQVLLRRSSAATPARACARPYYADSWAAGSEPCRPASRDRWVRHGWEGRVAVFAHSGGALVEIESHGAEETTLLAAVEATRPISAESLADQVRPVR
ncbi:hypothetical protein [Acrocarpospora phusangensis]|uniref:hypothetical protein n=1 Tax=Acrocarpospora phusangensis TaxID=1070424 RepID=UPI001950C99E|nr:hypothetical protein [Acrocarpospora phusangensis]